MHRETLADGTWVDIRDAEEVTQRGRRGIQAIAVGLSDILTRPGLTAETKFAELDLSEEQADAMFRMQEATVVAFVAGWSRDEPLPTLATIGDLPGALYDELARVTAPKGASLALDTSASLEPDPKDPSGDSESSVGPLRDSEEPIPIPS